MAPGLYLSVEPLEISQVPGNTSSDLHGYLPDCRDGSKLASFVGLSAFLLSKPPS